jgi:TPR repeat protein
MCTRDAVGVTRNMELANDWWTRAANAGHAAAMNSLGISYIQGRGLAKPDQKAAFDWYTKGSDLREMHSCYNLAVSFYRRGTTEVARDLPKALELMKHSAEGGLELALVELGRYYSDGIGMEEPDRTLAIKYWRRGAEKGSGEAAYELAMQWLRQSNYVSYAACIERAAELKYDPAISRRRCPSCICPRLSYITRYESKYGLASSDAILPVKPVLTRVTPTEWSLIGPHHVLSRHPNVSPSFHLISSSVHFFICHRSMYV